MNNRAPGVVYSVGTSGREVTFGEGRGGDKGYFEKSFKGMTDILDDPKLGGKIIPHRRTP